MRFSIIQFVLEKKWFVFIVGIISLLTIILLKPNNFYGDYDLWWNLAYGKHFVTNHTFYINEYQFQWTPKNASAYIDVNWLGTSMLYLIYKYLGANGLIYFKWLCNSLVFLIMLFYVKKLGNRIYITHFSFIFICSLMFSGFLDLVNQHTLSFVVFVYFLFSYFLSRPLSDKWLWYLPVIFIFWINLHHGFMFGFMMLGVFFIGEIIENIFINKSRLKDYFFKRGFPIFLSFFTIVINPYGIKYPLNILRRFLFPEGPKGVNRFIKGLMPTYESLKGFSSTLSLMAWLIVIIFSIMIILSIFLYIRKKYYDIPVLIGLIVCFYYSMQYRLGTAFFGAYTFFFLFYYLYRAGLKNLIPKFSLPALILSFGIFLFMLKLFLVNINYSFSGKQLEKYTPKESCNFILNNNLPGPIYNPYLEGGYMIWKLYPKYKVFLDPRFATYDKKFMLEFFQGPEEYAKNPDLFRGSITEYLSKKYGFNTVLLRNDRPELIFSFLKSKKWKIAFIGRVASVLVRNKNLPKLDKAYFDKNYSPKRFIDENDPKLLEKLFDIYINFDVNSAILISRIYEKNVPERYYFKNEEIGIMQRAIKKKI